MGLRSAAMACRQQGRSLFNYLDDFISPPGTGTTDFQALGDLLTLLGQRV